METGFHEIEIGILSKLYDLNKCSWEGTYISGFNLNFKRDVSVGSKTGVRRHHAKFSDHKIEDSEVYGFHEYIRNLLGEGYKNVEVNHNSANETGIFEIRKDDWYEITSRSIPDDNDHHVELSLTRLHNSTSIFYDNNCNMKIFDHNYDDTNVSLGDGKLLEPNDKKAEYEVSVFNLEGKIESRNTESPLCKGEFTMIFDVSHKYQYFVIHSMNANIPILVFHDLDTDTWVNTKDIYVVKYL